MMHLTCRKAKITDLHHLINLLLEDDLGKTRESKSPTLDDIADNI